MACVCVCVLVFAIWKTKRCKYFTHSIILSTTMLSVDGTLQRSGPLRQLPVTRDFRIMHSGYCSFYCTNRPHTYGTDRDWGPLHFSILKMEAVPSSVNFKVTVVRTPNLTQGKIYAYNPESHSFLYKSEVNTVVKRNIERHTIYIKIVTVHF
jgi:hypothetical protein